MEGRLDVARLEGHWESVWGIEVARSFMVSHFLPLDLIVWAQKYKEYEKDVAIEEIDGLQLVKKLAKNMEEMFHKKSEAVRVWVTRKSGY
ncbi:hypothetical protein CB1_000767001 [Camelus ferus]|nr:hypothetical protein CB1_000767001 [Camelus ferus]